MDEFEKQIILTFAENDMHQTNTAKAFNINVNGLNRILTKIALKTKYSPYVFYDLIELLRLAGKEI